MVSRVQRHEVRHPIHQQDAEKSDQKRFYCHLGDVTVRKDLCRIAKEFDADTASSVLFSGLMVQKYICSKHFVALRIQHSEPNSLADFVSVFVPRENRLSKKVGVFVIN